MSLTNMCMHMCMHMCMCMSHVHAHYGVFYEGSSTASADVMATKRSIVHPRNEGDRVTAVRLEYSNRTMLGDTVTTWGRVPVQKARAGGCALKQERVPCLASRLQ